MEKRFSISFRGQELYLYYKCIPFSRDLLIFSLWQSTESFLSVTSASQYVNSKQLNSYAASIYVAYGVTRKII